MKWLMISLWRQCALTVACLTAIHAVTGQIVVNPNGGGDYTNLQDAIQAASAGATIRVIGGTYGPVRIGKSLTIFCDPTARIALPEDGSGIQPPAVLLQGTGTESLTLAGILVRSSSPEQNTWTGASPAIQSGGFRRIRFLDCHIHGTIGIRTGAGGISASSELQSLTVVRSSVQASGSTTNNAGWAANGPIGIQAPAAVIMLTDSHVRSGDGGLSWVPNPPTTPCPCPGYGGYGGHAVVCTQLISSRSSIQAGIGGMVLKGFLQSWGQQPSGQPAVVSSTAQWNEELLPNGLMRAGLPYDIQLRSATWYPDILLVGEPAHMPVLMEGSYLAIDLSGTFVPIALPPNSTSLRVLMPREPTLVGTELAFQRITAFGTRLFISNPLVTMVLP